jgi:nucleoid DNA-binding protein
MLKKKKNSKDYIESEIIKELSLKYNLPKYVVERICHFPFKFLRRLINDKKRDTLYLEGFGKFVVIPYHRNKRDKIEELDKITEEFKSKVKEQQIDI